MKHVSQSITKNYYTSWWQHTASAASPFASYARRHVGLLHAHMHVVMMEVSQQTAHSSTSAHSLYSTAKQPVTPRLSKESFVCSSPPNCMHHMKYRRYDRLPCISQKIQELFIFSRHSTFEGVKLYYEYRAVGERGSTNSGRWFLLADTTTELMSTTPLATHVQSPSSKRISSKEVMKAVGTQRRGTILIHTRHTITNNMISF